MNTLQFPLAKITLFFMVGLLLGYAFEPSITVVFGLLIVSGIALFVSKFLEKKIIFTLFVFTTSTLIGFSTQGINNISNQKNHYSDYSKDANKVHRLEISIREKLKPTDFTNRYFGNVTSIDGKKCSGKILIGVFKDSVKTILNVGNRILVESKISPHKKSNNPNQFDYGNYLNRKSVWSQVSFSKSEIQISSVVDKNLWYYAANFREKIIKNLQKNGFHEQELQVANALILGQQQEIDKEVLQNYQFAGAVHMLSVSGLHVGYIMLFLNFVLGFLPRHSFFNWMKFIIIIVSLWAFAFVAGLSPSVVRSATMFSFIAAGLCLSRQNNIFHTLVVSLLFILLIEPSFIFDVGFQLSYVSLFFILWLQPLINKLYEPKNYVMESVWDIFTVSLAAQIGAFPLSIYYFHQFPGLFFITNMIVLPFLGIVMLLGIAVMIGAYFDIVSATIVMVFEKLIFALNWVIAKVASVESFVLTEIPLSKTILFALYLVIITWILWFEKSSYKKLVVAMCSVLILQMSIVLNTFFEQRTQEMLVFQVSKKTLILERNGSNCEVFADLEVLKTVNKNLVIKNYMVGNFIKSMKKSELKNLLFYRNKHILIVDSAGLFSAAKKPDIAIITQSPKLNFERFLNDCNPKIVVADGSNYKSLLARWEKTCKIKKIPFHATAEKGFYKVD